MEAAAMREAAAILTGSAPARSCVHASNMARALAVVLTSMMAWAGAAPVRTQPDHREFDATLDVPYHAGPGARRGIVLYLSYPDQRRRHRAIWQLALRSRTGAVLRRWHGNILLGAQPRTIQLDWDGHSADATHALASGSYLLRLQARAGTSVITQEWPVTVGAPAPLAMPPFRPLATGTARMSGIGNRAATALPPAGADGAP